MSMQTVKQMTKTQLVAMLKQAGAQKQADGSFLTSQGLTVTYRNLGGDQFKVIISKNSCTC